ncbi:DNA-binding protein [Chlamydoabsidia padenii]|nr:DNA-binding protein [Chlamydoabsidia padenii]
MPIQDSTLLLCDFIQVWIHQILYQRHLYPKGSFEQRKHYNVPVAMSIHPGVCDYIKDFVTSLQPFIEKEQCHLISLVIQSTHTLERHVFQMDRSTTITTEDDALPSFRACLLKLNAITSPPPPDAIYTLGMELKSNGGVSIEDKTWIPGDTIQSSSAATWSQLVPIKTFDYHHFKINTYVMESRRKGKQVA